MDDDDSGDDSDCSDDEELEMDDPLISEQEIDLHHYKPLNADLILRQIVERKCYESNAMFNLDTAIAVSPPNPHCINYVIELK